MKSSISNIISGVLLVFFLILFPPVCLAQASGARARVMQPVNVHQRVMLRGNIYPLARPDFDQGAAPDSLPMERILLVLQRGADQQAALEKLLDNQQIESSAQFHQWLTPEQFGEQFGPADSDILAVTDWLASQGFQVTKVSAGRTVIEFSGTAGMVRQALATEIHKFRVNGADYWANSGNPQIPAALAPVVAGFASLNNFPKNPSYRSRGTFTRAKASGKAQPAFSYPVTCSNGGTGCYSLAVGPGDFATIYNVLPLWTAGTDGTGQTIAVVGETDINLQDVADFRTMFGLPANQPNLILNGPDPGILTNGEETESDLDVEWAGAVAKGATIDFVVSETTEASAGIDLSALYIIDNNLASVMSESYSACEASLGTGGNQFYKTLWEQAAAQGITVLLSTGDSGSAGCDSTELGEVAAHYGLAVSGIASTPFNVAVGGTDLNLTQSNVNTYWSTSNTAPYETSAKSYIPEITWNISCAAGGSLTGCTPPPDMTYLDEGAYLAVAGGGRSNCINPTSAGGYPGFTCSGGYSKPTWQGGTGVPSDGVRDIPDISLLADGYVICEMDVNSYSGGYTNSCDLDAPYTDFQVVGGTSASVQAFAGIMALVDQAHGRQGNANYVFYPLATPANTCAANAASVSNKSCIFYDTQVGNNSVICAGGSLNCSNTNTASGQYGILVYGTPAAAAYGTTSGYDLATGLGSVNVSNLVNQWKSNFTTSTTSLALSTSPATSPITLTHGQPIDFTVNVTSGSGTPSGEVSLIAQAGSGANNVTGIGPFTLSGGSVSSSTIMLPGGSYKVTAHYAGNGTYAASDSTPGIPVTVSKESSLTEIRLVTLSETAPPAYNITSVPYGSPYMLRMDVTNSSGQLCAPMNSSGYQYVVSYPCPTGSLTVSPAPTDVNPPPGTVAGSYTLNSQGYAEDQPIQQPPGVYNFVASYAGDNSYKPSISSTVPITITKAPTTTSITGLSSSVSSTNVSFTVMVGTQSNAACPSGPVLVLNNGALLGTYGITDCTPYSPSTGTYVSSTSSINVTLPVGTNTVTVQYGGDTNYAASNSSPVTVSVSDYTMAANPSSLKISAAGKSATSTITLAPENGFTGNIALSCSTEYIGVNCTLSPSAVSLTGTSPVTATLTVSTTGPVNAMLPALPRRAPPIHPLPVEWVWELAGLLALAAFASLAASRRRMAAWLFAAVLVVVGAGAACGGGGSNSTPPAAPNATVSPSGLTFSQQGIGSTSPAQSVLLTDTGTAALEITSISMGGADSGDFAETNTCSGSLMIESSCTIMVTFKPTAAGSRNATLSIADNASSSPQTVALTGTAVVAPEVSLSPSSLSFGQENENLTTAPQTVTLSNTGSAQLSISNIGFNYGDFTDFHQSNNCGNAVPSGSKCTISVTYSPSILGAVTSSLGISDSAGDSPQTVSVTGTGVPPVTAAGTYWVYITGAGSGISTNSTKVSAIVQ